MSQFEKIVQNFDPATARPDNEPARRSSHWEIRTEERPYAFLPQQPVAEKNRYGQLIDLVDLTGQEKSRSLFINENPEVGSNPNRNKQHGFFFTADNCIGCHACEAACSEKNENPPHIAYRSVGYVEGGSWPDYKRMNISMACNHCDDPVCLKGCPTRAYTKHVEYGAVLQDPQTCFGCGYCTWVCPYNAPQLDPVKGQVSKCNMCVDRLEVGLKPACVSACVGNALDFGVIENIPENREQCLSSIPGFPDHEITHPNIRFQQMRTLPIEMSRTDSSPVKYHRNEKGQYRPVVDQKAGKARHWNLARLNSRENPLVLFTLSCQAAFGLFAITFIGALLGFDAFITVMDSIGVLLGAAAAGMTGFGLLMSISHLGKPWRFYRGFNNLRYSPMCREGLGLSLFATGTGVFALFSIPQSPWIEDLLGAQWGTGWTALTQVAPWSGMSRGAGIFALVAGASGLYYMYRCYCIKARPFWNHWQTASSFAGNALSLGALAASCLVLPTLFALGEPVNGSLAVLAGCFMLGVLLEGAGLLAHHHDLNRAEHEGAASHYVQCTTFGKTWHLRNSLLLLSIILGLGTVLAAVSGVDSMIVLATWSLLGLIGLTTALIGRALFYILVIPTTMPGAFFWKNKAFEEHARDIGLADNPASGVVHLRH